VRIKELEAENRELQLDLADTLRRRDLCEDARQSWREEAERRGRKAQQYKLELDKLRADRSEILNSAWNTANERVKAAEAEVAAARFENESRRLRVEWLEAKLAERDLILKTLYQPRDSEQWKQMLADLRARAGEDQ
jgi:chromosome segregation ATPase